MKRLLILLCVAGLLAAIPLSHVATAAKPAEKPAKVEICHIFATVVGVSPEPGQPDVLVDIGEVISVSENALGAHLAHGDYEEGDYTLVPEKKVPGYPAAECYVVLGPIPAE